MAQISEAAAALHRQALVIDSHNDSIVYHIRQGNRSMSGQPDPVLAERAGIVRYLRGPLESRLQDAEPQLNWPKMRAGGLDAAFFAVDVTRAWRKHLAYALDAHGFFAADLERHADEVLVARCADDICTARASGKLGVVLTIENSEALDGSINVLRMLHHMGIRAISLTHNPRALAADGIGETRTGGGLTEFGLRLVQEMNQLGILVDVSHLSERGFWDVMEVSR